MAVSAGANVVADGAYVARGDVLVVADGASAAGPVPQELRTTTHSDTVATSPANSRWRRLADRGHA